MSTSLHDQSDARLLLRHALELRLRVRQQLNVMSPHEFPLTEFAYVDNETGDREIVRAE
jgi:predicted ATP-dependent Lon-type protease